MAAKLQQDKPQSTSSKSNLRSPPKQRSRRAGQYQPRNAAGPSSTLPASRHSSGKSSDDSDEDGENAPLMTTKENLHHHVRRVLPKAAVVAIKESRPLSASTGNVNKTTEVGGAGTASVTGSQSSLASPIGSSTSSLDSPLDTTDNEVYKTVIPKNDSSRRENSLAFMLNRAINETGDVSNAVPTPNKPDPNQATTDTETVE